VKNQLTQELQHLTTSFTQLKQAQAKFVDCGVSVKEGLGRDEGVFVSLRFVFCLWGVEDVIGEEGGRRKGKGKIGVNMRRRGKS